MIENAYIGRSVKKIQILAKKNGLRTEFLQRNQKITSGKFYV